MNSEQRSFLDLHGYLVIENVLRPEVILQLQDRLNALVAREGPAAGSARLTRWQKRLSARSNRLEDRLWVVYGHALILVKAVCNRYVFRFAPALKDRMMNHVAVYPRSLWGMIWAELLGMIHAAACEEAGAIRLCDLVNKDSVFDACFADTRVLEAVQQVIGADVKLSSLNFRSAQPGGGSQPLHIDWFDTRPAGQVPACNTLWLLDDLTEENGATRVVPGSHRRNKSPAEEMVDPWGAHDDEMLILARAGSVLILNGQLWHGGTLNRSPNPRRLIQTYFVGREVISQLDQSVLITPATLARLSPGNRSLLGIETVN